MGTTAQVTAWSATVMGTTAQVTAWTAGGGPWGRGPLVLATYYCDFRCLNTKPFFINTDIWASIKCRFPDILIWISEAVFQNLIISHNRGKCLSESPKKKKTQTPLIPALRSQRQADFWVWGEPGLQSEFLDSQGYTEKRCLEKPQLQQNKNKQTKTFS